MIETQIFLTEEENNWLQAIASHTGKTIQEFIKQVVIDQLHQCEETQRQQLLAAFGIWRDRDDILDLRELRQSAERFEWNNNPP